MATSVDEDKAGIASKVDASDVDTAFGVFEDVKEGHIGQAVDSRALLWKIDLRLMPLRYVRLILLNADPNQKLIVQAAYPANFLLQKLPVAKFMSTTVCIVVGRSRSKRDILSGCVQPISPTGHSIECDPIVSWGLAFDWTCPGSGTGRRYSSTAG
jgi:hypothetical protein